MDRVTIPANAGQTGRAQTVSATRVKAKTFGSGHIKRAQIAAANTSGNRI